MTEAEWAKSDDPEPMLGSVLPNASDRKRRLFAVACCRRIEGRLVDDGDLVLDMRKGDYHAAVDAAGRFADGRATEHEMSAAFWKADDSTFCNVEVVGASRAELRKAFFGDDAGWVGRVNVGQMSYWDAETFEAAPDPAEWLESSAGEEDHLISGLDPFRGVAGRDATEVGETVSRQVLLLVRTHLGREAESEERAAQAALVRDVFGNPLRPVTYDPSWLTSTVVGLANAIYDARAFHDLPILADALQDAGCDDEAVLAHCRGEGPHVRGCWVTDMLLQKS